MSLIHTAFTYSQYTVLILQIGFERNPTHPEKDKQANKQQTTTSSNMIIAFHSLKK